MVTLQTAENALKTVYLGAVTELLNTKINPLMTKIEQTTSDVWGKEIRKAVSYGINGGIGAGDEDSILPAPAGNNYLQFVTKLKNLYGQIEISDKAVRASSDERGSFVDLLNAELQGLLEASKFNLGRMLYGDGSGKLADVSSSMLGRLTMSDGIENFIEGLVIDLYNNAGELVLAGARVTRVDRASRLAYINNTGYSTFSGGSAYVQGSKNKEITGLGALFSNSATLYGVTRAQHQFLNPYQQARLSSEYLDEAMIQTAIDSIEMNSSGTVNYIACSLDVKQTYQNYMAQFKRNIDVMELAGGFKSLSYNGIPLIHDRFIGKNTMYLLDTTAFKLHQLCDWRYLENENGKILRQNQGKPTYTATLVKYCDLICEKPNAQGRITNIWQ
ncbi:MAG: phage major capsid protein [Firmicutes bacterium]|nr:phage major capsid protein [Bacillota bacterium]